MRRLTVLALAIAALAAACGGGGTSNAERLALVSKASAETLSQRSARLATTTESTKGGPSGGGVNITSAGVFDFVGKAGSFTVDMGSLGASDTAEFRVLGNIIFFKAPPGLVPGTKSWIKIDLSDPALAAAGLGGLDQITNTDPSNSLSFLKGIAGNVEDLGSDTVRGTKTTHYSAVVDTAKALAAAGDKTKRLLEQTLEKGVKQVPIEVWIDNDGRLRRVKQVIDMSKSSDAAAQQSGKVTTTVELFDFGVAVDIAAPPEGETLTFAELQATLSPG
jgi:cytochrome c556